MCRGICFGDAHMHAHTHTRTLWALLSDTLLQILLELVTPLKGHALSHAAVHWRCQRPPKGLGTNGYWCDYGMSLTSKHAHKRKVYPPWVKKECHLRFYWLFRNYFWTVFHSHAYSPVWCVCVCVCVCVCACTLVCVCVCVCVCVLL